MTRFPEGECLCVFYFFDLRVFDEAFYMIYILFIYIIYNSRKVFTYFFIVFIDFKSIDLFISF